MKEWSDHTASALWRAIRFRMNKSFQRKKNQVTIVKVSHLENWCKHPYPETKPSGMEHEIQL
jgi:hypothetical protein